MFIVLIRCESTTTLSETEYFGEKAYLSQSGQLYMEAGAMAFNKVYCFGPTFRAEKSKTRRHLTEFWMVEPEVAFNDLEANMQLAERFLEYTIQTVLTECAEELKALERDTTLAERAAKFQINKEISKVMPGGEVPPAVKNFIDNNLVEAAAAGNAYKSFKY